MKKRILYSIPVIILIAIICISMDGRREILSKNKSIVNDQLSEKQKLDDFEYLYNILKDNYPFFEINKRLYNTDWLSNKERYIDKIKDTKNDDEFYQALQEILGELHNGHTSIVTADFYEYLLHDYQLDTINLKPLFDIINNSKVVDRYKKMLGKIKQTDSYSSQVDNFNNNIRTEIIGQGKIAYIAIKSFGLQYMENDAKAIREFLSKNKGCQALIIDIRGNTGGSETYWKENIVSALIDKSTTETRYLLYRGGEYTEKMLKDKGGDGYSDCLPINEISKKGLDNIPPEINKQFKYYSKNQYTIVPNNSIKFKGKIYLLVDRYVYSASESFAVFAKSTGFAALVGETTGGDGIGIDPALGSLPNSGFLFRYSQVMGLTSNGTCNEEFKTKPDIDVYDANKGTTLSKDIAVKKVLQIEGLE